MNCLCADAHFMAAAGACNAANCTVVEVLRSTNETFAACGIPVRDQTATLMGMTASFGSLALLMVAMRLADRAISAQAELGWDDLLIGLSGVCNDILTSAFVTKYANQWQCLGLVPRNECASHRRCKTGVWKGHVEHPTRQYHC